jgi:hypothetical protein
VKEGLERQSLVIGNLGALHTMAEGREAVDFHQSSCKNPRVRPLDPSHYGREAVGFFLLKYQSSTRSWPLDWRGYFEQGIKWHAPLGLDFGLGLWRLHTIVVQVERLWEFMAKGLDFGFGLWRLHTMPG